MLSKEQKYRKEYYKNSPKYREYLYLKNKERRIKKREEINSYAREWRKNNPEKIKEYNKRRKIVDK